jgi:hypothetical protein
MTSFDVTLTTFFRRGHSSTDQRTDHHSHCYWQPHQFPRATQPKPLRHDSTSFSTSSINRAAVNRPIKPTPDRPRGIHCSTATGVQLRSHSLHSSDRQPTTTTAPIPRAFQAICPRPSLLYRSPRQHPSTSHKPTLAKAFKSCGRKFTFSS